MNTIMARRNPLYTPHQGLTTNNYAAPLYDTDDKEDSMTFDYDRPINAGSTNKQPIKNKNRSGDNLYSLAGAISNGDMAMVENELYSKSFH